MKKRDYKLLLVVTEVARQQLWMYQNNKQSIEDRIVSLTQPHIRPIVRGKAGKPGEFGAKFSASCIDGYIFLDRIIAIPIVVRYRVLGFEESGVRS